MARELARGVSRLVLVVVMRAASAGGDTSLLRIGGYELRATQEEPPRLAVRDAVSLMCRVEPSRAARMRIDGQLKEVVTVHEFSDSRWHRSPVIAVNLLYRLLESLPPECTDEFVSSRHWDELRFQWGKEWASPASSHEPPPPPPPPLHMLAGGRCVDPSTELDEVCDVCFEWASGTITAVAPWSALPAHATPATICGGGAASDEDVVVHRVRGLVVAPGFVAVEEPWSEEGAAADGSGAAAVGLGVTSTVAALPGAADVREWTRERVALGSETNFGVAVGGVFLCPPVDAAAGTGVLARTRRACSSNCI
jgi:hypothetical protein